MIGAARGAGPGASPLLEIRDLRVEVPGPDGAGVAAVEGVSLTVEEGEILGLVGESGSGKSLTAMAVLGLLPDSVYVAGGEVLYRGEDLTRAGEDRLRRVRGREIGAVFQDPSASLNPVLRVGDQVSEAVRAARDVGREEARRESVELLGRVGIPDPGRRYSTYPHELSGGLRQRAALAVALAGRPSLLLADEPTSALDVTVQSEVLDLLSSLQREGGMAVLFISHDLAVVARVARRVAVMYGGTIVEEGPVGRVLHRPRHPYAEGLLRAVPGRDPAGELAAMPGRVPSPGSRPPGCRFRPRCPHSWGRCRREPPLLGGDDSRARCWLVEEPGRRRDGGWSHGGEAS